MALLVQLRIIPIGVGTSLSGYVARVVDVLRKRGVKYVLGPMSTSLEVRDFEELAELLREVVDVLRSEGIQRIAIDVSIDARFDKESTLERKVASVEEKLKREGGS